MVVLGRLVTGAAWLAIVLLMDPGAAVARGGGGHGWHGAVSQAEAHAGGGRRHGNDGYMKAAAAERDKLLNTQLKSICRGC
jgi:hypothetical protein